MVYQTLGLVTGGGDAPGLNAVIRAVVRTAIGEYGLRVIGIENSFEGLLAGTRTRELHSGEVRGILPLGGTILGTRNRGRFVMHTPEGREAKLESSYHEALANIKRLGIDCLVVVGGEGTLGIGSELDKLGVPVVGVPKTIDNDLSCTELTFGFASALDVATQAIDRLRTTAESHERVMILEVMGRHTGWIALQAGIAGGADVILIPEIPFSLPKVIEKIRQGDGNGSQFSIMVVAEGACETNGKEIYQEFGNPEHAPRLGGIGFYCRDQIERLTGKETRCVVLGHLQRGGAPQAFDRMLATNFGACAVRALMRGERAVMVGLHAGNVLTMPIAEAIERVKTVPPASQLIRTARDVGISFCAPDEEGFHNRKFAGPAS